MCIICIDLDKETLTYEEAWRNLGEMKEKIEPEHFYEVRDRITEGLWEQEYCLFCDVSPCDCDF